MIFLDYCGSLVRFPKQKLTKVWACYNWIPLDFLTIGVVHIEPPKTFSYSLGFLTLVLVQEAVSACDSLSWLSFYSLWSLVCLSSIGNGDLPCVLYSNMDPEKLLIFHFVHLLTYC